MTSRDFGFTTLRSAVAYRPDNSIVSPNNVYITKTNGAAVFSDTLKISTINVSTATISTLTVSTINGGSGGGQVLSQSGDNILLSGGGGSVNVSQTTTVSTTTQKTTALTYNAGIQLSNFSSNLTVGAPGAQTIRMIDGDIGLIGNATQVRFVNTSNNIVGYLTYTSTSNDLRLGSALPLTINSQSTITLENITGGDIILNSQAGRFRTLAIDGRMDFVGGDLIITALGHNIDIIAAATRFQNMINVSSMLNDNNGFGGTAGQVLTAGTGGQVIWSTISSGGGSVNSVTAGSNIAISGTASNPIVNVDINSTLNMNGYPIVDTGTLTLSSISGNISIATSLPGTSIVNNIELNNAKGIAISTLGPPGAPLSLPISLNATGEINLTAFGNINTYSFSNTTIAASNIINLSTLSTLIILDQTQGITLTANNGININGSTLFNGSINVASTFYDNNVSSGTAGQVLTAGSGGQVIWSTISSGGGSVNSVIAGTNISTSGTATNPVVSVHINSTLYMNGNSIISNGTLGIQTDNTVSDLFLGSGRDIYINTISDKIYIGAGKDVIIGSSAGNIILSASTLSGNLAMTAGNTASITAPILTLPSLANASAPKMLYYNTSTKAISYSDPPIGNVNSVIAGTNISTSGTASNPIVNVNINSTLLMNGYPIYDNNAITIAASSIINISTLSTSIILDQTQGITLTANNGVAINGSTLFNGTINLTSTFYDNNVSSGTAGQVLTAGTGGQVIWSTISGGGGVNSVIAGTNISTSGTASNPIVNVNINSTLLMNGYPIYDNNAITIAASSIINLSTLSTSIVLDQTSQDISVTAGNDLNLTVGSTGKITATGTGLLANTAGISSGNYLSITINGTLYKIALLAARNGWATRIAGIGFEEGRGVIVDSSNNIIVTGSYASNPVYIYNADGSTTLSLLNSGTNDVFIVKYNGSDGAGMWATRIAGTGDQLGYSITVDSGDNIIVTGSYLTGPVTIYNAPGTSYTLPALPYTGFSGAFIVKYNSSGIGIWATRIVGSSFGIYVTVDSNNNIIVTGSYSLNPLTIYDAPGTSGTLTLPNSGTNDAFIIKYNSSGVGQWATRIAGAGNDYGLDVTVDSGDNIIVTGAYSSNPVTIYDAPGTSSSLPALSNSGSSTNVFIVKYNGSTGAGIWATKIGDGNGETGYGIAADSLNNIIVTGYYYSNPVTIYDAPGTSGTLTLPNSGSGDAFIVKYNGSTGAGIWATRIAGTADESGIDVAIDSINNIIVTGSYQASPVTIYNADGNISTTLLNSGSADVYIVKYNANGFAN